MAIEWKGVYPALTTNFTADDELDLSLFTKNLLFQVEAGVDGVVIGGSLGEASTLTLDEKERLVKTSVEVVEGKIPVLLNIAEGSTRDAVNQARLAKKWKAEGLMLLPPMRYKSDARETVEYFRTVAQATDLPIMLYNNPVEYRIEVTLAMFESMLDCETIQAVKESTRDVTNVTRMINAFGDRYKLLCGVDTIAMEELLLGAHGWVAGLVCAFPAETVAIYRMVRAGMVEEAAHIYRWFMPLLEFDIRPKLVQYIKLAETMLGYGSEHVRAPRLKLAGKERADAIQIIEMALANAPVLPDYLSL
jgi:4-hydroxy-tetrahydrodipicolinate synthase